MVAQHFESVELFFENRPLKGETKKGSTLTKCWEESPNTRRQHASKKSGARFAQVRRDGECHRKDTA